MTMTANPDEALIAEALQLQKSGALLFETYEKMIERLVSALQSAGGAVPEPVYKAVERILDDHSAWIARPNDEVTKAVAFQAVVAAQKCLEQLNAEFPDGAGGAVGGGWRPEVRAFSDLMEAPPKKGDPPYPKKDPTKPFWLLEHPDGSWLKTRGAFIGGSLDPRGVTFTQDADDALWWPSEAAARSVQFTRVIDPVYRVLKATEHKMAALPEPPSALSAAQEDDVERLLRRADDEASAPQEAPTPLDFHDSRRSAAPASPAVGEIAPGLANLSTDEIISQLQMAADWHDLQECKAEGFDMPESGVYHEEHRKRFYSLIAALAICAPPSDGVKIADASNLI